MQLIVFSSAVSIFSETPASLKRRKLVNHEDINIKPWNLIPGATYVLNLKLCILYRDVLVIFVINRIIVLLDI